jgi:hypothetical protein
MCGKAQNRCGAAAPACDFAAAFGLGFGMALGRDRTLASGAA